MAPHPSPSHPGGRFSGPFSPQLLSGGHEPRVQWGACTPLVPIGIAVQWQAMGHRGWTHMSH